MRANTLIFLYNPKTQKYLEKLPDESGISWCDLWIGAQDFSDIFFIERWFLKLRLERKFSNLDLNLKWKKVLAFDGVRGVV
jgi:hypothetical protein